MLNYNYNIQLWLWLKKLFSTKKASTVFLNQSLDLPRFPIKKLLNPPLHFKKKLKYSKIYDGSEYNGTHSEMHNEMNKLNFYKWTGFFFHHILSMN